MNRKIIPHPFSELTLEDLVIGTHKKGKYRIYRFQVEGEKVQRRNHVIEGNGRIASLIVTQPDASEVIKTLYRYY